MVAVDDGNPRQRIEIELVEHADVPGASRWRRGRHADPPTLAPHGEPTPIPDDAVAAAGSTVDTEHATWGTERRRLVVTALAAGVIALFIGWALGRSGGGSGPEEASGADPSVTTSEPEATSDDDAPSGSAVPSVAPDDLPTTTRPFTPIVETGPTTTTVAEWVDTTVEVDPTTAPIGLELVAVTSDGLEVFDLATGEHSTFPLRRSFAGSPLQLFAGPEWIVAYSPESQRATVYAGDEQPDDQGFGSLGGPVWYDRATDSLLTLEQQMAVGPIANRWDLKLLPIDGSPESTIATYELPANTWAQMVDPAGGLIVWGPSGGMYHLGLDGTSRRLTTGQMLAIDADVVITVEGGEQLGDTVLAVTDRTTGERRVVESADQSPARYEPLYGYWGTARSALSPSGDHVTVNRIDDNMYNSGVLSLVDGSFVALGEMFADTAIEWSPDGRYALYIEGGKLSAYDTIERVVLDDIAPFAEVRSFTTRPA